MSGWWFNLNTNKSSSKHPYYPVASRRGEECLFVVDEEEVRLALVEGSCEKVWLRMHDMVRQTKRSRQPVHGHLVVVWDVVDLEWDLDFQHVCVGGQHLPWSVDLHKISLSIFWLLMTMTVRQMSKYECGATETKIQDLWKVFFTGFMHNSWLLLLLMYEDKCAVFAFAVSQRHFCTDLLYLSFMSL